LGYPPTRPCKHCNEMYVFFQDRHKFCSYECYVAYERFANNREPYADNITSATVGAIHELIVATDLLGKGYAVFRALSPNCDCDLIVSMNGELLRVEVTTRQIGRDVKHPATNREHPEKFDLLAVVFNDGMIKYTPEISEILYNWANRS